MNNKIITILEIRHYRRIQLQYIFDNSGLQYTNRLNKILVTKKLKKIKYLNNFNNHCAFLNLLLN